MHDGPCLPKHGCFTFWTVSAIIDISGGLLSGDGMYVFRLSIGVGGAYVSLLEIDAD
jgi:hypothetical protein